MSKFFEQAGALLRHEHTIEGVFPRRKCIVTFYHERGEASYDGRAWEFKIYE